MEVVTNIWIVCAIISAEVAKSQNEWNNANKNQND